MKYYKDFADFLAEHFDGKMQKLSKMQKISNVYRYSYKQVSYTIPSIALEILMKSRGKGNKKR